MKKGIISISREYASGGHTIAKRTAELLEIPCYDSEILRGIAKETGLADDLIQQAQQQKISGSFLYNLIMGMNHSSTIYQQVYQAQKKVILSKVAEGPCIIVGRGSNMILSEHLSRSIPVLRVFVYSDLEHRIARAVKEYHLTEEQAREKILESDRNRAMQSKNMFGLTWGERTNYDVMLNTGVLGMEECSRILAGMYRE